MKRRLLPFLALGLLLAACAPKTQENVYEAKDFVQVGVNTLVDPTGEPFEIRGVNLGQWLYPQAEAFGFEPSLTTSQIERLLKDWVGESFPSIFWLSYKNNFITREDLAYIASQGANTVRLPFHYKSFTHMDYLDKENMQDGFARLDSLVAWSKENGLYVILSMEAAPGGQRGDGTDDGYSYPHFFTTVHSQQRFVNIWSEIAGHFAQEPAVLGYEVLARPVGANLENAAALMDQVEPLYKEITQVIREVDPYHVIILDGALDGTSFGVFKNVGFDNNLAFAGSKQGGATDKMALKEFLDFKMATGRPVFLTELTGPAAWRGELAETLKQNGLGYVFNNYKGCTEDCMVRYEFNAAWELLMAAANDPKAPRPTVDQVKSALGSFNERVKFASCTPTPGFAETCGLK